MIRNVVSFSLSAILSQFDMRLSVPSSLTTIDPRWLSLTEAPPLLISSCVVELCGASGMASGFLDDVDSDVVSAAACEFEEGLGSMPKGR